MDREAAVEAAIAIGGVAVMAASVILIGTVYGAGLGPDGGLALVGAIGFFILLMSVIGVVLSLRN